MREFKYGPGVERVVQRCDAVEVSLEMCGIEPVL